MNRRCAVVSAGMGPPTPVAGPAPFAGSAPSPRLRWFVALPRRCVRGRAARVAIALRLRDGRSTRRVITLRRCG